MKKLDKLIKKMFNCFFNKIFLVNYEDFIVNFSESGRFIFNFIGEEFIEKVLEKLMSIKNSNSWDVLLDSKV